MTVFYLHTGNRYAGGLYLFSKVAEHLFQLVNVKLRQGMVLLTFSEDIVVHQDIVFIFGQRNRGEMIVLRVLPQWN